VKKRDGARSLAPNARLVQNVQVVQAVQTVRIAS
jgi:hypothetical protein